MQGTKPEGRQWNRLLDAVVIIMKQRKITIYHAIYIRVFYDGTVYFITFYTDYVLYTTNNKTAFNELKNVFQE